MTGLTFILVLICLIVFVLGVVGLFRPLTNLKMINRWVAACWILTGIIGFGAVAINSPTPKNGEAVSRPSVKTLPKAKPAWVEAAEFCTEQTKPDKRAKANTACTAILKDNTAPKACKDDAGIVLRGDYKTYTGGYIAMKCADRLLAYEAKDEPYQPYENDAVLKFMAKDVQACLDGNKTACAKVAKSAVMGDCEAYADGMDEGDDHMRGYRKASCESHLSLALTGKYPDQ